MEEGTVGELSATPSVPSLRWRRRLASCAHLTHTPPTTAPHHPRTLLQEARVRDGKEHKQWVARRRKELQGLAPPQASSSSAAAAGDDAGAAGSSSSSAAMAVDAPAASSSSAPAIIMDEDAALAAAEAEWKATREPELETTRLEAEVRTRGRAVPLCNCCFCAG